MVMAPMNPAGVALAIVPALINVGLAVAVMRRLPRDRTTQAFLWFVISLAVWQMFDVGVRWFHEPELAAIWRAMFRMGQFLAIPAGVHFALRLTERDALANHGLTYLVLYAPSVVFVGWYEAGLIREELVYRPTWGWIAAVDTSPGWVTMSGWFAVLALCTPAVLVYHLVTVRDRPENLAAVRIVTAGMSVPVLAGVASEVVLPILGIQQVPATSTTMSTFSIAAFVALTRYDLFRLEQFDVAATALATVTDPIVIASPRGRVLYANEAAGKLLAGRGDAARLADLIAPEQREAFLDGPMRRCIAGEPSVSLELELLAPEGHRQPVMASLAPVRVGPTTQGCVLVAHDVTPLRRAMEAVQDASRAKSHFLANMSHELRTPLNAIIGYSELLGEDAIDEDAEEDLHRIQSSGRYLLGLINDILDISKIESGKLRIDIEETSADGLIEKLLPDAREMCRSRGNRFVYEAAPIEAVAVDSMRLRQVLLNLVSNAAKFTHDGEIRMSWGQDGERVFIVVRDSGIGMDPAQLARLFEPFSQVHEKDHATYGGTGLGLAISRRLCRAMHGDLTVDSVPGEGSTFTVWLTPWNLRPAPSQPTMDPDSLPSLDLPTPHRQEAEKETGFP